MLGYDLKKNFNTPYFAVSFSDFWHRWHISLSTWFRDYVYIPLGGNKGSTGRVHFNILLTFLLSGLWHGANITFLIWGGLHGLVLIIEKQVKIRLNKFIYGPIVLIMVVLFWIPFRAEDYSHLVDLVSSTIHFKSYSFAHLSHLVNEFSVIRFLVLTIITILFLSIEFDMKLKDFSEWIGEKSMIIRIFIYYALILTLLAIGNYSVKPSFIYFQF